MNELEKVCSCYGQLVNHVMEARQWRMVPGMGDRFSGSKGLGTLPPSLSVGAPKVIGTELKVWRPHEPCCMLLEG